MSALETSLFQAEVYTGSDDCCLWIGLKWTIGLTSMVFLLLLSLPSAWLMMGLHKILPFCFVSCQVCCRSNVHIFCFQVFLLSIQVFTCLPLLLLPFIRQLSTLCGRWLSSNLSEWPNYLSIFFCILEISVSCWLRLLRMNSMRNLWIL